MRNKLWQNAFRYNLQTSILFSNLLLIAMMICVAISLSNFIKQFSPDSKLTDYLVWLTLLASLEVLLTKRLIHFLESSQKWILRFSEWILLAAAIKLVIYVFNGFSQLSIDIIKWSNDPLLFFTSEYIVALLVVFLIWILTYSIAAQIDRLNRLDEDISWEQMGIYQRDFQTTHNRLTYIIMGIGITITFITILSRIDLQNVFQTGLLNIQNRAPVLNVLVYFTLSLVLISLNQHAMLRTRWWLDNIPITESLAKNWFRFALIFFAVLALIAFLLPTNYTVGLLEIIRMIGAAIFFVIQLFFAIISYPFLLLFKLLSKEGADVPQEPMGGLPEFPEEQAQPSPENPALPWLDILKSFLFWGILIIVIGFSFYQYIRMNQDTFATLKRFRFIRWLGNLLQNTWNWLRGVNEQITIAVKNSWRAITTSASQFSFRLKKSQMDFENLSPREKIDYLYLQMIIYFQEKGYPRKIYHTPYKYQTYLVNHNIPEASIPIIYNLTAVYMQSRYSRQDISDSHIQSALDALKYIKDIFTTLEKEADDIDAT